MTMFNRNNAQTHAECAQKDKITILLSEYNTLRSELVARTGFGFQIGAVGVVLITWLLHELKDNAHWYLLVIFVCIPIVILYIKVNKRDIWRLARRLKELEYEINSRAREYLLVWETLWGAAQMNYFLGLFNQLDPLPRSALLPLDRSYRNEKPN
jgi:hypothetical protein